MDKRVSVLGAGVMGTALAIHLARKGIEVKLWGTKWDTAAIELYKKTGRCEKLETDLPDGIKYCFEDQLEYAVKDADIVILAVTSDGVKNITQAISLFISRDVVIANIAKGIDEATFMTMSEIIEDCLPEHLKGIPVAKIGGPLRAIEVAKGIYSEAMFACKNIEAARELSEVFKSPYFKSEVTDDIVGVEICAALKNAYAIAVGICEGIHPGMDNPKSAIFAQCCMELARFAVARGGRAETALGLAGTGDFYVTAQGGRNRTLGKLLGEGMNIDEALRHMANQTIEGYQAAKVGYKLLMEMEKKGLAKAEDFPILVKLYEILFEGKPAPQAFADYWKS